MVSPRAALIPIHLNHELATTTTCYACPGVVGKIKSITVGVPVLPTTVTLAIYRNAIALAATIAVETALVAGVAEEVTITATDVNLNTAVADIFKAVWTVTDAGGVYVGGACTIWIEPSTW